MKIWCTCLWRLCLRVGTFRQRSARVHIFWLFRFGEVWPFRFSNFLLALFPLTFLWYFSGSWLFLQFWGLPRISKWNFNILLLMIFCNHHLWFRLSFELLQFLLYCLFNSILLGLDICDSMHDLEVFDIFVKNFFGHNCLNRFINRFLDRFWLWSEFEARHRFSSWLALSSEFHLVIVTVILSRGPLRIVTFIIAETRLASSLRAWLSFWRKVVICFTLLFDNLICAIVLIWGVKSVRASRALLHSLCRACIWDFLRSTKWWFTLDVETLIWTILLIVLWDQFFTIRHEIDCRNSCTITIIYNLIGILKRQFIDPLCALNILVVDQYHFRRRRSSLVFWLILSRNRPKFWHWRFLWLCFYLFRPVLIFLMQNGLTSAKSNLFCEVFLSTSRRSWSMARVVWKIPKDLSIACIWGLPRGYKLIRIIDRLLRSCDIVTCSFLSECR